ncbi:MAG: hypothetical protein WAT39_10060 [Planctomycetota bacterium]
MIADRPCVLASLLLTATAAAQIIPGNLVLVRVGDGTAALTNASTAVFLDEYTAAGTFVQTIALPTATSGLHKPCTCSGTATSEGGLTQSADGRFLIVAGYGVAPGGASVASSASAAVNRVCARIGLDEAIDTTTALADAYSLNNVRGAASYSGLEFWTAGTASANNNPGVRFAANLGATSSIQLEANLLNVRRVDLWNGQVYCASASGTTHGISAVGSGLPTTSGQTIALLPGFPTASGPSPYDFWFANANTLYVADDRTNGSGGIQKWTLAAGTWTLQYTLAPGATVGCRGLSGSFANGTTTLFATTTSNLLVKVVDSGPAAVVQQIAAAATNTAWRGVRFVRSPASLTFLGSSCNTTYGFPFIGAGGGDPVIGNANFVLSADNTNPSGLVVFGVKAGAVLPVGVPLPGGPACLLIHVLPDVLASALADPFGSAQVALPIPYDGALGGAVIGVQAVVLDLALAFALPLGSTDAMQVVIGN